MTVARIVGEQDQALVVGSYAVPGAFTRDAWEKFVSGAIREASNKELQSTDWVLKTAVKDDLTLEGSPEQIQKSLTELYKADYAKEWMKFVQGVTISELGSFEAQRAGDEPAGRPADFAAGQAAHRDLPGNLVGQPVGRERTAWRKVEKGLFAWFKESILRRAPSEARNIADLPPEPRGAQRRGAGDGADRARIRRRGAAGRAAREGGFADERLPRHPVAPARPPQPAEEPGRSRPRRQAVHAADAGRQRLGAGRRAQVRRRADADRHERQPEDWRCGRSWCAR